MGSPQPLDLSQQIFELEITLLSMGAIAYAYRNDHSATAYLDLGTDIGKRTRQFCEAACGRKFKPQDDLIRWREISQLLPDGAILELLKRLGEINAIHPQ